MNKEINLFDQETESVESSSVETRQTIPVDAEKQKSECESSVGFQVKRIVEALLFACYEPLSFIKIREIIEAYHPMKPRTLRKLIEELQHEYKLQKRSFKIEEVAQGFVLITLKEYSPYIEHLYRNKRTEKLSQASTEVLAIIAYRQPITKPQIEAIRGVDSSGTLQNLLERGLIEAVGKLEAPGRPTLYGITKDFLTHFGLKDLSSLPKIKENS
jgi:segregation and condensation protein B